MNKRFASAMLTLTMLSTLMPSALANDAQQAAEVPQVAAAVAAQDQQPVEEEPAAEAEEAQEEEQQESEEPAEEEIQVQAGEDNPAETGPETESSTVTDIDKNEWTFTATEDTIQMEQGEQHITAELSSEGVLTFSGNGAMPALNDSTDADSGKATGDYPWKDWKDSVTKIVIEDGITSVGAKSFITWGKVKEVFLGKDVQNIGAGAFAQMISCSTFTVVEVKVISFIA